jgi:hypothetical protein
MLGMGFTAFAGKTAASITAELPRIEDVFFLLPQ